MIAVQIITALFLSSALQLSPSPAVLNCQSDSAKFGLSNGPLRDGDLMGVAVRTTSSKAFIGFDIIRGWTSTNINTQML